MILRCVPAVDACKTVLTLVDLHNAPVAQFPHVAYLAPHFVDQLPRRRRSILVDHLQRYLQEKAGDESSLKKLKKHCITIKIRQRARCNVRRENCNTGRNIDAHFFPRGCVHSEVHLGEIAGAYFLHNPIVFHLCCQARPLDGFQLFSHFG